MGDLGQVIHEQGGTLDNKPENPFQNYDVAKKGQRSPTTRQKVYKILKVTIEKTF